MDKIFVALDNILLVAVSMVLDISKHWLVFI